MTRDRVQDALIEALQQALAEPAEQRLYRSGKLAGLFASRGGVGGEAAARAVRDGLLEVVRTEVKGKAAVEWVRVTPRGIDFLHEHDSPVQVLRELQGLLRRSRTALTEMQQTVQAQADGLTEGMQRWTHQLGALVQRIEEALQRLAPPPPDGVASVPWAGDALTYLDKRKGSGAPGDCPLPEFFAALRGQHEDLSVPLFHDGLRRLYDRKALRLLPFAGAPGELPEPEYALVDDVQLLYYATR